MWLDLKIEYFELKSRLFINELVFLATNVSYKHIST